MTIKILEVANNEITDVEYTLSGFSLFEANLKKPVSIPYVKNTIKNATYEYKLVTIPYTSGANNVT